MAGSDAAVSVATGVAGDHSDRVRVPDDAGVADEQRRIVEEFVAQFLGFETDVASHLIEGARLLELLDGIPSLHNIEIGSLERRWLLDSDGSRSARGVIGLRSSQRLRSADDRETQRQGHDDRADPDRSRRRRIVTWEKYPTNERSARQAVGSRLGRDSAGTDERSRHCTDCWD